MSIMNDSMNLSYGESKSGGSILLYKEAVLYKSSDNINGVLYV